MLKKAIKYMFICSSVCIILTAFCMLGVFYGTDIQSGNYIVKIIIPVFLIIIGILLTSALIASLLSDRLVSPARDIDMSALTHTNVYPEIAPLVERIEIQNREIARQIEESFANGTEQDKEKEAPKEKEVVAPIPESAPTPKPAETEKKDSETKEHEIEESILNSMIGAVNMFIDSINNYLSRFPRLRTDPKYRSQTREIMVAARDYINDVEGDLL